MFPVEFRAFIVRHGTGKTHLLPSALLFGALTAYEYMNDDCCCPGRPCCANHRGGPHDGLALRAFNRASPCAMTSRNV